MTLKNGTGRGLHEFEVALTELIQFRIDSKRAQLALLEHLPTDDPGKRQIMEDLRLLDNIMTRQRTRIYLFNTTSKTQQ